VAERPMTREAILERFARLNVWSRGGQRAPHKPLLVLYALGRWSRGEAADIPFAEVDPVLTELLKEFGPARQSYHPEYPFWRLQNDGVWAIQAADGLKSRKSNTDPPKTELLKNKVSGGFSADMQAALRADPTLVTDIAIRLLETHFPDSLHADILAAVGLTLGPEDKKQHARDPQFRKRVLTAYEYRCAVCGLDVRLGPISLALDAAHIRWHQAGGPDVESNGLALCVLHHKLFDLGAFTLDPAGIVLVSEQVHGTTGFEEALLRHHGNDIRSPLRKEWRPASAHLAWHSREVFKGQARQGPGTATAPREGNA
jgi:putative restriction endonuclease